ncbi:Hypothetical predicted protein [Octopus vulgaris]|uniref:Uncharacterized protein n=1 Tax=Octopus vulgaris TaxID=6645 RepID=A0AA36B500_OCTVU|nr:Hypothetical predicted protein [Octopus vulgaris]
MNSSRCEEMCTRWRWKSEKRGEEEIAVMYNVTKSDIHSPTDVMPTLKCSFLRYLTKSWHKYEYHCYFIVTDVLTDGKTSKLLGPVL